MPGVSSDFLFCNFVPTWDEVKRLKQGGQSETKLKGGDRVHRVELKQKSGHRVY